MKKTLFIIYVILISCLVIAYKSQAQTWKPNPKYIKENEKTTGQGKEFQCYGTTKKGERCKRKVNADHCFCYQHANQK